MKKSELRKIQYQLQDLPKSKKGEFFNIVTKNATEISWEEILNLTLFYYSNNDIEQKNIFNRYFYEKDIKNYIEPLGYDFNFLDEYNNNFALHISTTTKHKDMEFTEDSLNYIISKTNNIYNINNFGRHLLFDFVSFKNCGLNGEKFFKLLKKYPNFDLHTKDNFNKNLLNYSLSATFCPNEIIDYLLDKDVDYKHLTKDSNNILHNFLFLGCNKLNINYFKRFVSELDITQKNKYNEDFLNLMFSFINANNVHTDNKGRYLKWLNVLFDTIKNRDFFYTIDSVKSLINTIDKNKTETEQRNPELISSMSLAQAELTKILLEFDIQDSISHNKKIKI